MNFQEQRQGFSMLTRLLVVACTHRSVWWIIRACPIPALRKLKHCAKLYKKNSSIYVGSKGKLRSWGLLELFWPVKKSWAATVCFFVSSFFLCFPETRFNCILSLTRIIKIVVFFIVYIRLLLNSVIANEQGFRWWVCPCREELLWQS